MKPPELDILAFGAHPDDCELFCGGLLLKMRNEGYTIGLADLTKGELSTKGSVQERKQEAEEAASFLDAQFRRSLDMPDGYLEPSRERKEKVARLVRQKRPRVVLLPYWDDFHPDHEAASKIVYDGCVLASRRAVDTEDRYFAVQKLIYYMQHHEFSPSFVVDVSGVWEEKLNLVKIFRSQVGGSDQEEGPETNLSSDEFLDRFRARHMQYGREIGVTYGEPYKVRGSVPLEDPVQVWADGEPAPFLRPTSGA